MGEKVVGFCPMGCGQTLFLGSGGYVTCSWAECPNPSAVADLLDDSETEHIVQLDAHCFTVRHPLRERLGDFLMDCQVDDYLADVGRGGPPWAPGRYRVREIDEGGYHFEPLQEAREEP